MKLHIQVDVDIDIDANDSYYLFTSTNPENIAAQLQERLNTKRRDLYEEITCAGKYDVTVTVSDV